MLKELITATNKDGFRFVRDVFDILFRTREYAASRLKLEGSPALVRAFKFFNVAAGAFGVLVTLARYVFPMQSWLNPVLQTAGIYITFLVGIATLYGLLWVFRTKLPFRGFMQCCLPAVGAVLVVLAIVNTVYGLFLVTHPAAVSPATLAELAQAPVFRRACAQPDGIFECQQLLHMANASAGNAVSQRVGWVYLGIFLLLAVWAARILGVFLKNAYDVAPWKTGSLFLAQLIFHNMTTIPMMQTVLVLLSHPATAP